MPRGAFCPVSFGPATLALSGTGLARRLRSTRSMRTSPRLLTTYGDFAADLVGGGEEKVAIAAHAPSGVLDYAAGDLVVIDSYRLHQIRPFVGERMSVTAHVVFADERWQSSF